MIAATAVSGTVESYHERPPRESSQLTVPAPALLKYLAGPCKNSITAREEPPEESKSPKATPLPPAQLL